LYATLTLFVVGFLILFSSSMAISYKERGSMSYYIVHQLLYGGIGGIIVFLICGLIPYRAWKALALPLMVLSFILLALIFIPEISYVAGGARRWLTVGPISFQPSEILKFGFIIYLASWLNARRNEVGSISYGMVPFALMLSLIGIFLVMQPDLGTFGVIVATAGMLYFLGGGTVSQIATLFAFASVIFYFLVQLAPYRAERLLVFLNPSFDPKGIGYQINQAFIAIGSGGFWGLGFGKSLQKYSYLPEPITDSIFAIYAEEMGLLGVVVLLALFGFFFWRALIIAKKAPDIFGQLLAMGFAVGIMVQVGIHVAAISGLMPLTGIVLPFVSYGSTSLIITMAMAGIILNVSKYAS